MVIVLLFSILTGSFGFERRLTPAQEPPRRSSQSASQCTQPTSEQSQLLREAVEKRYTIRRVEFIGNERTRDNVLRRRIMFQEGDAFTRKNLIKSLRSVSRLKIIYPVKMSDVIIQLDKPDKIVDLKICVKERHPFRLRRAS
jgi:uncharacterized Rmd1/YagE family protein